MSMSNNIQSAKLCDERVICVDNQSFKQEELDYHGDKIYSRKFPTLSTAENVVEETVLHQQLFIIGGFDLNYNIIDDQGYFMLNLSDKRMTKITLPSKKHLGALWRAQASLNTLKLPIEDPKT